MSETLNPFEGMKRKRLPGMHLITANDGGMPLNEALAAHFFSMLHDKVQHDCLIKKAVEEYKKSVQQIASGAKTPDGATLSCIFGMIGLNSLFDEEWSYLDDKNAFIFILLADAAIEQTQRWIAWGSEKPYQLPALGGDIVLRPQWAINHFGTPDSEKRREAREYIKKLLTKIPSQAG